MIHNVMIGIVGIISGILCAKADVPLAWSGIKGDTADAKSVGKISDWWIKVDDRHFDRAFWHSCIGQPGTYLVMWKLADIISENSSILGLIMKICTFIGAYTGLLFHAAACIKPIVYRRIFSEVTPETAQAAMDAVDRYPKIPSIVSTVFLILGSSVFTVIAVIFGFLDVPKIFVLFNPVGVLPVSIISRKMDIKIGGALGIGFALLGIVLIAASV
ncbi:MAG: hypothetical protein K6C13_15045 [Oscillospiraceae bacterium]|nr:hypothetical protein [Oscillospiraceae bacterium]